ncbi:hypothetical protein ACFIOY_02060 [Bradyrhizobium sp. TZ2]
MGVGSSLVLDAWSLSMLEMDQVSATLSKQDPGHPSCKFNSGKVDVASAANESPAPPLAQELSAYEKARIAAGFLPALFTGLVSTSRDSRRCRS